MVSGLISRASAFKIWVFPPSFGVFCAFGGGDVVLFGGVFRFSRVSAKKYFCVGGGMSKTGNSCSGYDDDELQNKPAHAVPLASAWRECRFFSRRPRKMHSAALDDDELNINPPTPCQ